MTALATTDHSDMALWPTWVWAVLIGAALLWVLLIILGLFEARDRHIHYFTADGDGYSCATRGCDARRDRHGRAA